MPDSEAAEQLAAALAARAWPDVVTIIDQHWSVLMATDIAGLRAALDALPSEVVAEHPRLAAARNYVDFIPAEHDGSVHRPVQFRDTVIPGPPLALLDVLAQLTSRAGARRSAGAFDKAVESAREAREVLADAADDRVIQVRRALPDLHFQWGKAYEFAGDGLRALREYRDAFDLGVLTENELIVANAAGSIAWLAALGGHVDEAQRWLDRMPGAAHPATAPAEAVHRAESSERAAHGEGADGAALDPPDASLPSASPPGASLPGDSWRRTRHATTSRFAQVLIAHAALDTAAAEHVLRAEIDIDLSPEYWAAQLYLQSLFVGDAWDARQQLSAIASAIEAHAAELSISGLNLELLTLARVEVLLVLQQPQRARQLVREAQQVITRVSQSLLIARARTELVAADYSAAARLAEAVVALEDARPRALVSALLIRAAAALHLGETARAAELVTHVLSDVADDSLAALTVVSRDDLERLAQLIDVPGVPDAERRVRRVLERGRFTPASVSIMPLSPRERSVLAQLPGGATVAEIAATLRVSPNTVKSQLRSMYRKLGVATREDAEAVAMRYGLLD